MILIGTYRHGQESHGVQIQGYLIQVLAAGGEELEDRRADHDAHLYIMHKHQLVTDMVIQLLVGEKGQLQYHKHSEEAQVVGY